MNLTFTLNISLLTYRTAELNEQCKSADILYCSFNEYVTQGDCNTGSFTTCFNALNFQNISIHQEMAYSEQIAEANALIKSDLWCVIKAQILGLASYLYSNIILLKQKNILEAIEEQEERCNDNIIVDLSETLADTYNILLSEENTPCKTPTLGGICMSDN